MNATEDSSPPPYGKLVPPYPVPRCAASECSDPVLTEETGAFMFTDLVTGKLIVFCGTCSPIVELHHHDRWRLVML